LAFLATLDKVNLVEQYYQFKWDDSAFGLTEHKWMQYIGAYKNLFPPIGGYIDDPIIIRPLAGKTKLVKTQVIDAAHILNLIDTKIQIQDGIQFVDDETLRIIYEQIQELSNMGQHEQSELLKEFVNSELVAGHIPANINFDDAYQDWRMQKKRIEVDKFAIEWGINADLLADSLDTYSLLNPETVPNIDGITKSLNFVIATIKVTGNKLGHSMSLTKRLPIWMSEIKHKYT
jgi:type I restriction enzyme R subunit